MECRADHFAGKNIVLDEGVPFVELEEQVNRAYVRHRRSSPSGSHCKRPVARLGSFCLSDYGCSNRGDSSGSKEP